MTSYIKGTEQAKMIRNALKVAFPGFKFDSIRVSRGSAIDISWTDGPTAKDVDAIVQPFSGGYFDGMEDYRGSYVKSFQGKQIGFLADFIFTRREVSKEFVAEVKANLAKLDGQAVCNMMNNTGCMMMHDDINDADTIALRMARFSSKVFRTGNPEVPVMVSKH